MRIPFLAELECPFCGSPLAIADHPARVDDGRELHTGVLGCECCAYPVVDGIPVIRADDSARELLAALDARQVDRARARLLGLDGDRLARFTALEAAPTSSFMDFVPVLGDAGEGTYFAFRFSDPTFVVSEALVSALVAMPGALGRGAIDVGGGAGHLTRRLAAASAAAGAPAPILADYHPWKLWLARRFVVPSAESVCIDANVPLPFAAAARSFACCSDAFHYIWSRRLLAGEMRRVTGDDGVVLVTHMHNMFVYNPSAGMPLSPRAYAHLAAPLQGRLFGDDTLRRGILESVAVDLGARPTTDDLVSESSLTLVAARDAAVFTTHALGAVAMPGEWRLNPLYRVSSDDTHAVLTLEFPSSDYDDEFGACRAYLPQRLELPAAAIAHPAELAASRADLVARRVLVNVPFRYLPPDDWTSPRGER
ncbi:MAG: hypothetical protein U0Q12_03330 [Vicinamibacterales bacterium]